jgi:septum formation protein
MAELILASTSSTRAKLLSAAGLAFHAERPPVDEEAAKASLRAEGLTARDQADALAELKALAVSRRMRGMVLGADQMLALEGKPFDKPRDMAEARAQLRALRGKTHTLITATVIAVDGAPIWRRIETPNLTMRDFSDAFLDDYLATMGDAALDTVGAYQLEGRGAQLFSAVEGDYFSILGLPLLAVLGFLREHGIAER